MENEGWSRGHRNRNVEKGSYLVEIMRMPEKDGQKSAYGRKLEKY